MTIDRAPAPILERVNGTALAIVQLSREGISTCPDTQGAAASSLSAGLRPHFRSDVGAQPTSPELACSLQRERKSIHHPPCSMNIERVSDSQREAFG